jgi:plasmid stability protein
MSTLTIHALEPAVEKRIRSKAKRDGRSLNQTLKELLAASVGVRTPPETDHRADFKEFHGIWNKRDAREFKSATADLETIDPADWQP